MTPHIRVVTYTRGRKARKEDIMTIAEQVRANQNVDEMLERSIRILASLEGKTEEQVYGELEGEVKDYSKVEADDMLNAMSNKTRELVLWRMESLDGVVPSDWGKLDKVWYSIMSLINESEPYWDIEYSVDSLWELALGAYYLGEQAQALLTQEWGLRMDAGEFSHMGEYSSVTVWEEMTWVIETVIHGCYGAGYRKEVKQLEAFRRTMTSDKYWNVYMGY